MRKPISLAALLSGILIVGCNPSVPVGVPPPQPSIPPAGQAPRDPYVPPDNPSDLHERAELARMVTQNPNVSIIERLWKVKLKSMRHRVPQAGDRPREQAKDARQYELLFVFTEELTKEEIERITQSGMGKAVAFEFYLFDSENVVLKREPAITLEGEITGVRGDAFRMFLRVPIEMPIARIEAREPKVDRRSFPDAKDAPPEGVRIPANPS